VILVLISPKTLAWLRDFQREILNLESNILKKNRVNIYFYANDTAIVIKRHLAKIVQSM
jgi:hypothetical protein